MNWNEYFINIAREVAKKSKDPSTQVGCVITTANHHPISFGYNGFVANCDEQQMTFDRPMKYHITIHAEMNAILFAQRSLEGCHAYVTHGPCENCLKHLMQAGITQIIYEDPGVVKDRGSDDQKEAIKRLLSAKNIVCRNINGSEYLDDILPN